MTPVSHSRPGLARHFWLALGGAVVCLGVVLVWTVRPRSSAGPATEALRGQLTLRDGRLYAAGTGEPFTGSMIERRPDGTLQARSSVSNGLLEGLSEGWHTNGQRQVEELFHDGVSDGPRTKWHPNGQKLSEATIKAGKLEGVFRRWDEGGALSEEISMRNGKPDGWSRAFYPSGFLKAEARMEQGNLLEQHFWKDGERKPPGKLLGFAQTNSGT